MSTEQSFAAWQRNVGAPLEVGPADTPAPGPDEILVRNRAIAINPVDWILQDMAIFPWLDYPAILGSDVASPPLSRLRPSGLATSTPSRSSLPA